MGDENMLKEFPDQKQRAAVCYSKQKKPKHNSSSVVNWKPKKWKGDDYLVAPVVLLTEGVHNNLYYPPEEIRKTAHLWNGVQLVVEHPVINGLPVSANSSPDIAERQGVGRVFNVSYSDGKLRGEVYLKKNRLQAFPQLNHYLMKGTLLEVSTGLYSDDEQIPGTWRGERYTGIVRNHKPDHLALLPGGVGACSAQDGCGIRLNRSLKPLLKAKAAVAASIYRRRKA